MATPLDFSLMERFGVIFPFLLVLVFSYAILSSIKIFGDRNSLYAFIALILSIITLFSSTVSQTIMLMAPWFVLFFFFIVFLLIAFMVFGAKPEQIIGVMKGNTAIIYWIIGVALVIWIGSMASVISSSGGIGTSGDGSDISVNADGSPASSNQNEAFWATITHPKVLGLALILLIATFTVQRLSGD